ncbi:MAG: hypothetical protein II697_03505, partial [Clostridia bacterium]|nr:hypothetical protein [Clostridia bacterium]
MKTRTLLCLLLVSALLFGCAQAANESHIIPYLGAYDAQSYPPREISAVFTDEAPIAVDGQKGAAYGEGYAFGSKGQAHGTLYTAWTGPVLYLFIEINDPTLTAGEAEPDALMGNPACPAQTDSVTIGIDLYNDKVVYETDTIGTFNIDCLGLMHFFRNGSIPSLGSVMADPIHPEYQNRILEYAAVAPGNSSYFVEVAIDVEGLSLDNGSVMGLEVQINDVVPYSVVPAAEGETVPEGATARVLNRAFLSHQQMELYSAINDSSPNCTDWANLSFTGKPEGAQGAFSTWRIDNTLRYLDSISFPKDVYTPESQAALSEARAAAEKALTEANGDMAKITAAADQLGAAITALRWADTRYPDPDELTDCMTLPNPYQFFQSER